MRRLRNRIVIVGCGILILLAVILLFTLMTKGCSKGGGNHGNISTQTIEQQQASNPATNPATEPVSSLPQDLQPTYFKTPVIKDDNTNGELIYSIYVWNKTGYELFGSSDAQAQNYADTINTLANRLSGLNVYDMVIPNHTEYGLPERFKSGEVTSTSQADNIKKIYAALGDNVTPINAYNYLADHNTEYTYFNSDHHWTGLGAYYAYKAFADTNELTALSLEDCAEQTIDGFTGTFTYTTPYLKEDSVHYWELPYTASMDITYASGEVYNYETPYYSAAAPGAYTYGVFLVGDNPLTVIKSSSEKAQAGKKIAIIKESYGNCLAPYFTNNYEEVHVIDFRDFRSTLGTDLKTYCTENDITDVLFVNGVMSANTQIQLDSMLGLVD